MRSAVLLLAAVLTADAKDIPFEGNVLCPDYFAKYLVSGHRVELTRGVVTFYLADSGAPSVEIVTPSVAVQPFLAGEYRVEVNRFGETNITPAGGDVRVVAPQGAQWVSPGQKMIARGPASAPEFRIVDAVGRWGRLANRIATAVRFGSVGVAAGAGSEEAAAEPARRDERKPEPASKPEPRTHSADHPNNGPTQSAHPGRGK